MDSKFIAMKRTIALLEKYDQKLPEMTEKFYTAAPQRYELYFPMCLNNHEKALKETNDPKIGLSKKVVLLFRRDFCLKPVCLVVNTGGITWRWKWIKLSNGSDPGYKLNLLVLHRYFACYEVALSFYRSLCEWRFQKNLDHAKGLWIHRNSTSDFKVKNIIIGTKSCICLWYVFWMW